MATLATLTRQIFLPNFNANGAGLDAAIGQLNTAILANTPTVGPIKETTLDNQYTILTVIWPSTNDAAFVSGGTMATVATALGLTYLPTHVISSTAQY